MTHVICLSRDSHVLKFVALRRVPLSVYTSVSTIATGITEIWMPGRYFGYSFGASKQHG